MLLLLCGLILREEDDFHRVVTYLGYGEGTIRPLWLS